MQHVTLRQQAYAKIKEKLILGEFPAGSSLSETQLAKDLGMSRTPIREAIRQMEMEGILEYSPRFSVVVKKPTESLMEEMFGVREALEAYASSEAALSITPKAIKKLEKILATMESIAEEFQNLGTEYLADDAQRRYNNADMAFHSVIVEASDNAYLTKLVKDTKILVRVFTSSVYKYDLELLQQANEFHRRLFEAISSRDAEKARTTTIEAMHVAKSNVLRRMAEIVDDDEEESMAQLLGL